MKSEKNKLGVLDHRTQQRYDVSKGQRMQIEDMIFQHMVRNDDYYLYENMSRIPAGNEPYFECYGWKWNVLQNYVSFSFGEENITAVLF